MISTSARPKVTLDGNEAAASIAYRCSQVIAIYPITPSSTMGELADEWASRNRPNLWSSVPAIMEMQSEGGAAGTCHGALQAGALSTTFTASQGLLLMIPSMYKIAGELTPFVMHVSARTLASHALSIFGDHQDVMATRQTGFALLNSTSVQEAHDMAAIAHAATLRTRIPFLHFFDGFRTSHEVAKIEMIDDQTLLAMLDQSAVEDHRRRALNPEHPVLRGSAQNPDTFFQAREACNVFYDRCPTIVQQEMDRFAGLTGRSYRLFDYVGAPDAQRVIIMMGSGADAAQEAVEALNAQGQKVGLIKVRLYRPFDTTALLQAIPTSCTHIAVLDRTKEPGAGGEPLYLDVVSALFEAGRQIPTIGGRYGLSSKEFTPAMVKAVYDQMHAQQPQRRFTVGINDDVTGLSLKVDPGFTTEADDVFRAVFFGLGADGTVGANKNTIKIIGEETDNYAQGYFVYDSKKSGAITISHLRFGPRPIRSSYLIAEGQANFVAIHQSTFLDKYEMLSYAGNGATVLLNTPFAPQQAWDELPVELQQQIIEKKLRLFVIDALKVARDSGMRGRINTVMQTCFFAISGVLRRDEAIGQIKKSIEKTYGRKGQEVVQRNFAAVDQTLAHLHQVEIPSVATSARRMPPLISDNAPDFVKRISAVMLAGKGDLLPVSAFPVDGTWPTATSQWEKRNLADQIPAWDKELCIQCNKCAMVCPHAAIRAKVYDPSELADAPATFAHVPYKAPDLRGSIYTLQVSPLDCTGCSLCVDVCPAKDKAQPKHKAINMVDQLPLRQQESENYDFFLKLPEVDRTRIRLDIKGSQFFQPLFEYSGACSGCGETPYIKLLTQLFGDRMLIANATGCSSIYGGNLPTTPYCQTPEGRGPAWANSLFEDNAEFGLGMRLGVDALTDEARRLLVSLAEPIGQTLVDELLTHQDWEEAGIAQQRSRVEQLRSRLAAIDAPLARRLELLADYLVRKTVWILGGDGWAYDIGFGGLDHVLSTGQDVNILVMDTEVYSNTGGQASKATPIGAAAKFAALGKSSGKKDLGLMAMSYGNVYVAKIAFGAKDAQTLKALREAESYPGPSLIIAYSHCIAHGYDLAAGLNQQKLAVDTGYWPLYRYDPRLTEQNKPAMQLDSSLPKGDLTEYMRNETRFRMVEQMDKQRYDVLVGKARQQIDERIALYQRMASGEPPTDGQPKTKE
ncbi:MAG: pyruvate:ferredoxin (flavodoxin) oxidoreductase [Phycisphaerales bacterium]|nr:pyruvate:ferredoxin (flavodoxin) oxidoreductase [Phycisphaerales bacterium]